MKFKLTTLCLALLFCSNVYAQQTFNIKGVVKDTMNNPLVGSTILLLNPDSTMVSFTRSELDGSFKIKDVKSGNYIIKSTYLGFLPLMKAIVVENENLHLEDLAMTEMAKELMEVVIKEAKAPVQIRGDTVIYDASTFKVPPGSTVEDLLKKLPGIEVDQNGSIKSDGQDVTKVTVDGKNFFGSDPKAATKNLPAEGISKVSVYDKKTEQSEITGNTSNSEEKTMDLELKEGFKSGGFGRIVGGVGTYNRAELKGNYNKFNDKIQFSLVGVGNNTGRNGLGWNDYQDFMGSQSFQFDDDGEYGFSSNGFRMFIFGGTSGNDIEGSIQNIFFGGNSGGLPENYNGGVNFNYDNKKMKFTSMYFYNFAGLDKITNTKSIKFLPSLNINQNSENNYNNDSHGHRTELSWEYEIDSLHTAKVLGNGAYIDELSLQNQNISLQNNGQLTTTNDNKVTTNSNGYLANGMAIFRKKFKKDGRSMGLNTSYKYVNLDKLNDQNSILSFYNDIGAIDSTNAINRIEDRNDDKKEFKANAIYVEPVVKNIFSEVFVNYSNTKESGYQDFQNIVENKKVRDEAISRNYNNLINRTRIGNSWRYSKDGLNFSLGLAFIDIGIQSDYYLLANGDLLGNVDENYRYWTPNLELSYSPVRSFHNSLEYSKSVTTPSINQLQPFIDNTNPLYITEGNPTLNPEVQHRIGIRSRKSFIASGIRIGGRINYSLYETRIINYETVDENLITYIKPVNYNGGDSYNFGANFSMPIIKNKIKFSSGYYGTISNSFAFVNTVLNKSLAYKHYPYLSIDITPTDFFGLFISANYQYQKRTYEINSSQNQVNTNLGLNVDLNTKLFAGIYFTSGFNYDIYKNDRFGLNQTIPILNASLYRHFLKGNKLEVRLSLYDAFNRNRGVNQYSTEYGFNETSNNSLGRYFMLSATYNIKGLHSDLENKNRWW